MGFHEILAEIPNFGRRNRARIKGEIQLRARFSGKSGYASRGCAPADSRAPLRGKAGGCSTRMLGVMRIFRESRPILSKIVA